MLRKPLLLLSSLMLLAGCGENTPQEAVTSTFVAAMDALHDHRYDEYMESVDYGCEMDSIQRAVLVRTYSQYLDRLQQSNGDLLNLNVVDVAFGSDTVCDVYYEMLFADSTSVEHCQKMVRIGDVWKLRARN